MDIGLVLSSKKCAEVEIPDRIAVLTSQNRIPDRGVVKLASQVQSQKNVVLLIEMLNQFVVELDRRRTF